MVDNKFKRITPFVFQPFSDKQMKLLTWWQDNSPVKDKFMIVSDGSVRSGKTVVCALSFVLYTMTHFNHCNAALAGKAQPLYSNLLTPEGYKKMGNIKDGDYVYNRNGKKVKVIGTFPQGKKDIYKVTFSDGSSTECSDEHLWAYTEGLNVRRKELKDIIKSDYHSYAFPLNGCVEFDTKEIFIDSFFAGELLENYDCDIEYEIKNKEEIELLNKYNLYESRIHKDLMFNNADIRTNILSGILCTARNNNRIEIESNYIRYYSFTHKLLKDVIFIARSLGLYVKEYNNMCEIYGIKLLKNNIQRIEGNFYRTIERIDYVGKEECQCIFVDDKEHLYLTDDMIVTHNTVLSVRRNVLSPLKQMLLSLHYDIIEHRHENYVEIIKDDICNNFFLFGGKDEASQDLVQGLTLSTLFIDEVALVTESFYVQATARLSVEGAKLWTSSNPNSPYHWFYTNVIKKLRQKNGLYVHFTMRDNPSLSQEIIDRYEMMYSGVWKKRYIDGQLI